MATMPLKRQLVGFTESRLNLLMLKISIIRVNACSGVAFLFESSLESHALYVQNYIRCHIFSHQARRPESQAEHCIL